MNKSLVIIAREIREKIGSRSFILFSVLGPLIILSFIYLLFTLSDREVQKWNVLITDKAGIMQDKIAASETGNITYFFANDYIEHQDFASSEAYQQFDAMIEINEKILANKIAYVFYRSKPSYELKTQVKFQVERRLEEVMIHRFTELSVQKFREIKQPIKFAFRNVFDPYDKTSDVRSWVGYFFGVIILIFIALFGMTILRSISSEKSNRIVEILMATVKPRQLMIGKIAGIGISAFIQFIIWALFIGLGLYLMRETMFPNLYEASNLVTESTQNVGKIMSVKDQIIQDNSFNNLVNLVYERIHFGIILFYFTLFFISGYFFYGAFFAAIGSTAGTESDGQQFIIPILILLGLAAYAGYFVMSNPESAVANFLHYLPFTSPVVVMVKLTSGYQPGEVYQLWLALIILILSAILCISIASRLYKNGILQFGHRVKLNHLIKWLKK